MTRDDWNELGCLGLTGMTRDVSDALGCLGTTRDD